MQPAEPKACKDCRRQKYTDADLERWRREVDEITRLGGDPLKHNPEWARGLCWTKHDAATCNCTPLSTTSEVRS